MQLLFVTLKCNVSSFGSNNGGKLNMVITDCALFGFIVSSIYSASIWTLGIRIASSRSVSVLVSHLSYRDKNLYIKGIEKNKINVLQIRNLLGFPIQPLQAAAKKLPFSNHTVSLVLDKFHRSLCGVTKNNVVAHIYQHQIWSKPSLNKNITQGW